MSPSAFLRSFRIVAPVARVDLVLGLLASEGFHSEPEPFSPFCRRLVSEPFPVGSSLAAIFGYIYVQDRSSMLPPLLLDPPPGGSVLDMAASPGSKSGFLAQLAGAGGFVLANEPARDRLATLRANLQRANLLQAATCQYPGEKLPLFPGSWPYIALDPPCSGWGTADKHPRTLKIWRGDKLQPLIALQRALLRRAAELLAPGGRLLYSTCTTNGAENEEQIAWAIAELGLKALKPPQLPGFTFEEKPHATLLVNGEASGAQSFYLSLLTKSEKAAPPPESMGAETTATMTALIAGNMLSTADLASDVFTPGLLPPGLLAVFGDKIHFLPPNAAELLPARCRWQGMPLGRYAHGHFQPDPSLRCALPPAGPRIVFETATELRRFLSGAAIRTDLKTCQASLWWRSLPLGTCRVKNGRPIASR